MSHHEHERREERCEHEILERIWEGIQLETQLLREIIRLLRPHPPTLSSIKLIFSGGPMPQGPVTISVGQKVTASVVGFDQNGYPRTDIRHRQLGSGNHRLDQRRDRWRIGWCSQCDSITDQC